MNDLEKMIVQLEAIKEIVTETVTDENRLFVEGQLFGLDISKKLIEKLQGENNDN